MKERKHKGGEKENTHIRRSPISTILSLLICPFSLIPCCLSNLPRLLPHSVAPTKHVSDFLHAIKISCHLFSPREFPSARRRNFGTLGSSSAQDGSCSPFLFPLNVSGALLSITELERFNT